MADFTYTPAHQFAADRHHYSGSAWGRPSHGLSRRAAHRELWCALFLIAACVVCFGSIAVHSLNGPTQSQIEEAK